MNVNGVEAGKCVVCEEMVYVSESQFKEDGEKYIHWSCKEENKKVESFLDAAISEINYALNSNKSKEVKEVYLENAIRYINTAKEQLEGKENKHG